MRATLRAVAVGAIAAMVLAGLPPAEAQQRGAANPDRVRYQPADDVRVERDIVYASYGDRDLQLDLYLPAERGAEPIPAIVVIRGGGWRQGDKNGFAAIAARLAGAGFAAACIEYRVSDEAPFPAAVNDTKAAVRWLKANADGYGLNPDTIGAIGGSSGAHLAAYLGTTHRMDELDGDGGNPDESNRVHAVVALAVVADFTRVPTPAGQTQPGAVEAFLGAPYGENPDLWALASPLVHVHAGAAPLLLIHSDADGVVPYDQSVRFEAEYEKAGATAELVTIEGAPHAFWHRTRWFEDVMDRSVAFFRLQLTSR